MGADSAIEMPDRRNAEPSWPDRRLVDACLKGDETAWNALVDKYKNLTYAIILRQGVDHQEAMDLFQSAWLDAYNGLPGLRRREAFKSWLASLVANKCYHFRQQNRRRQLHETAVAGDDLAELPSMEPAFDERLEKEQVVRESIFGLPPRCQEMIRLLFFTFPPKPYQEVAERLGLATGSIGFIRQRCLKRLQKILKKHGIG